VKILIVKVSALGDVVHALPVLAWLKSADPDVQIDWLVEEGFAALLDGHPLLRRVHRIATKSWRQKGKLAAMRKAWEMTFTLRREQYDVVLDLQGNSKSGFFTLLSGARLRYGFAHDGVREWPNLLATNRQVALSPAQHHISDRTLAIARAAFPGGTDQCLAGPLPVTPGAAAKVADQLAGFDLIKRHFAVLHYGTTWQTKLWSVENWQQLVCLLADTGDVFPVLTWGSAEEKTVVDEIAQAAGSGRALVWPRGTLPELVALLSRAAVVVGGDTGPVHIAAAVGTPTVSLFRVTDNTRNGPRGDGHIRLQAPLDCSPCLLKECERDGECGRSITATSVMQAISRLLSSTPKATVSACP